ncbi:MAG: hypothetical protein GX446_15915 [Chthonomonadales bacterium]|nr:hypothetical protein [Chthonomonadales bacterium]
MTPREIIRRNLTRTSPARIGMNFSGGRMNDMTGAGLGPVDGWEPRRWTEGNVEFYTDEWGNVWHRLVGMSRGGEIHTPALDDWSKLSAYRMPDLANPKRFEPARAHFACDAEHYRVGFLPGFPFAICRYLRKMEVYFQDLVWERDNVDRLHARVTDLLEAMIIQWADVGADGIMFCEDWGVQNRLLISPRMWRQVFRPLFARLCSAARERGMDVIMHSCGFVWDILDDLADCGVNAMQFDQPSIYGLDKLAQRLRANGMALHAPVDIQQVLPTGDRERIEREAQEMVELFGGAFIAKDYPDLHGIGVQPEWDGWAYDVFAAAATAAHPV